MSHGSAVTQAKAPLPFHRSKALLQGWVHTGTTSHGQGPSLVPSGSNVDQELSENPITHEKCFLQMQGKKYQAGLKAVLLAPVELAGHETLQNRPDPSWVPKACSP